MNLLNHLRSRGVRDKVRLLGFDEEVAVFPLYNLSGQLVGYQNYRPDATKKKTNNPKDARYYTHTKVKTVWGLEYLNPYKPVLFLVEGVFDAVKLVELGFNAVATLGNDPVQLKEQLALLPYVKVAVCDNDPAGKKLAKYAQVVHTMSGSKDLGELSWTETHQLAELLQEKANEYYKYTQLTCF